MPRSELQSEMKPEIYNAAQKLGVTDRALQMRRANRANGQ